MSGRTDWTFKNITYLSLLTVGYICGEIAHFLINTSSKAVAQGIIYFYITYIIPTAPTFAILPV